MRPQQWVKNAFVLAPLMFSQRVFEPGASVAALAAFVSFCLASSAAYVFNDVTDRDRDRSHPLKRQRPIAAGRVSVRQALRLAFGLIAFSLVVAGFLGVSFLAYLLVFLLLQALYSSVLKSLLVIDVLAIATGFVLRAAAGVVAVGAHMSSWLLLCTFLLALFLALGKRRHEVVLLGESASEHREVLGLYSVAQLDRLIAVVSVATAVAYGFYSTSPVVAAKLGTDRLVLTVPFVVLGLFRYLFLIYRREEGGSPADILLGDGPLQAAIALWLAAVFLLLYR